MVYLRITKSDMKIIYFDTEINPKTKKILSYGAISSDESKLHTKSFKDFADFIKDADILCGHNILKHDLQYLIPFFKAEGIKITDAIDTLPLSALLFPDKPYHKLVKDEKLQSEESNNPLNDAIKAKILFLDEKEQFNELNIHLKSIFFLLLSNQPGFKSFFRTQDFRPSENDICTLIKTFFQKNICTNASIERFILENPTELAYALAIIQVKDKKSISPPWVLKTYPKVDSILTLLRNTRCIKGCNYCDEQLNILGGLKKFFDFDAFRPIGGEPLQEKAVQAAVDNKSILAVFPTGGGKSLTFQLPALIAGETTRGLTVVISPLQSLMKDQVDNLERIGITEAVTVNGLLDPIDRAKSLYRVENGSASMLYISPEALRSKSIDRLLLGRKIARFVIDEAHCFSSWGQDFRVDYLYIAEFIKNLQEKKGLSEPIPISCFTATAKLKVVQDIQEYFRTRLSIEFDLFTSSSSRTNLQYKIFQRESEKEKYQLLRELIEEKNCPTIIYTSRTKTTNKLSQQLREDDFNARAFHGKMDKHEKTANQDAFIKGEVQIMVATSAFGMGVDKKDVGLVVHFEISDSLENYIQEAGRAGRDENIVADCYILYNEDDLSKHFILLNQTKLSLKEVQQVWKTIKNLTSNSGTITYSALEIARKTGWDDDSAEIETRVKTAILALEEAGYIKRGKNMSSVYADSIQSSSANEAISKIQLSDRFTEKQKVNAIRVIRKLFSVKNRKNTSDESAESRIDHISEHLGVLKGDIIEVVNLMREINVLGNSKDLTAFISRNDRKNKSRQVLSEHSDIEDNLLQWMLFTENLYNLKELNDHLVEDGLEFSKIYKIKNILNYWAIKNIIHRERSNHAVNFQKITFTECQDALMTKYNRRKNISVFIIDYLFELITLETSSEDANIVEFSVLSLKDAFNNSLNRLDSEVTINEIEDALFYLSKIEAIKIDGGFMVIYNQLSIERIEKDNHKRYTQGDYESLNQFYKNKVQQIHIVGEYATKMISSSSEAQGFVEDYFQANYASFLNKYFPGERTKEIDLKMTPKKYKQIFGELSKDQNAIIQNSKANHILIAAGPGSGKTRVLVSKLASLILMEDIKSEQLLMLTFSRASAIEFKKRLIELIGNAAHFVDIKTFHSYCFDILGKKGSIERSDKIINDAVEKIDSKEIEIKDITKTVLVIDEAQDMNEDEFRLIQALMRQNEEMKLIAVGDDDQNIYKFRGANSDHFFELFTGKEACKYELVENYRSLKNLVAFSNAFIELLPNRSKQRQIRANQQKNGTVKLTCYKGKNLIVPMIEEVKNAMLSGSTAILTKTNSEALIINGLLKQLKIPAKLIQSNDSLNLFNILEVRFFFQTIATRNETSISSENWTSAKRELKDIHGASSNYKLIEKIIEQFDSIHRVHKYKSDFEIFIKESRIEDFTSQENEVISVATIHKAKGREFNNVFILLEDVRISTDQAKRAIYVGLTRAKENLSVHTNSNIFSHIEVENQRTIHDNREFPTPKLLTRHLNFKDVWLDFFISHQHHIDQLKSGDTLFFNGVECTNTQGVPVLNFSKKFRNEIQKMNADGYALKSVSVIFIVYWKKEGSDNEYKVILPEVVFERS